MKIALIQVASPSAEPMAERRERVAALVRSAADADLIVLPELWAVGYFSFDQYDHAAETGIGATLGEFSALAIETNSYIHVGSYVERTADGALRNTAALLDRRGRCVHSYSKVHVFGYRSQEAQLLQPGDRIAVADTEFGPVAGTTCYDLRFPELWRGLVDLGARIVIVPAAWPSARREHWRLFTSVRAVEEQVIVIACNAVGWQGAVELAGHSRVVDPWGTAIVEAGADESITYCDIDPQIVDSTRTEFPVLGDRLEDYANLLNSKTGRLTKEHP